MGQAGALIDKLRRAASAGGASDLLASEAEDHSAWDAGELSGVFASRVLDKLLLIIADHMACETQGEVG